MEFDWIDDFSVAVEVVAGSVILKANREGLLSLARHFTRLAEERDAKGAHFHLDEFNSLEEGSAELIVERME